MLTSQPNPFLYYHSKEELELLKECINGDVDSVPLSQQYLIKKYILIYHDTIIIDPDDDIRITISGRKPIYSYPLHSTPYLSPFLKNGVEIPTNIFLDSLVSFKINFSNKYRLFISGILYQKN